jgi:hypothetical protein
MIQEAKQARYYEAHKEQRRADSRKRMARRRASDPIGAARHQHEYRVTHLEEIKKREKAYLLAHKEERAASVRRWKESNPELYKSKAKEGRDRLRIEVLARYSKGFPACECCGEKNIEFLTVDHIGGSGNVHRRQIGEGALYGWLRKNKFPDGFRVLCMNCNWSIGIRGYCPHSAQVD